MRSDIRHSGALNDEQQFTFKLIEMRYAHVAVDGLHGGVASVRLEVSETELRDLVRRARYALEDCRLRGLFDTGALSYDDYNRALRDLDREPPPNESEAKP